VGGNLRVKKRKKRVDIKKRHRGGMEEKTSGKGTNYTSFGAVEGKVEPYQERR